MKNKLLIKNPLLTESAQKMAWLVEERGIAGAPWNNELNNIAQWIRKYVKMHFVAGEHDKIEFGVPQEMLKSFYFFREIEISGISFLGDEFNTGGGKTELAKLGHLDFDADLANFTSCKIAIYCFHDGTGKVYLHSILISLFHEFNHAYEYYMRLNKERCYSGIVAQIRKASPIDGLGNAFINDLIYRLFSDTERNALVNNFYGELCGKNIDRKKFSQVLPTLLMYGFYEELNNRYEIEIDNLSPEECNVIYKEFRSRGISLNLKKTTVSSFKKAFKQKTKMYLGDLIRRMGKAASLWFDIKEKQDESQISEILVNDPSINIPAK